MRERRECVRAGKVSLNRRSRVLDAAWLVGERSLSPEDQVEAAVELLEAAADGHALWGGTQHFEDGGECALEDAAVIDADADRRPAALQVGL